MINWDEYFLKMADLVASKSKDPSTKAGAVIVGPNHEIRSTGYNGFPRGVVDSEERYNDRPTKYMYVEHAERNAIYNAARHGVALDGCSIYINGFPCNDCARAIIQSGIKEIIISASVHKAGFNERWAEALKHSRIMLEEAGVKIKEAA